ncbi:hypothetical protein evm_011129 [Chilo suppressalis]|nr:hypothetical protein evm_011129 [Chilo suppressalis]
MNTARSSHPSIAQLGTLVEFLEANRDLAKGFSKNLSAKIRAQQKWEGITFKLNSMGGTIKNSKKWIKYWSDKKSSVKKKVALRNAARRRTGGGIENVPEITEIEERILILMGGDGFACGDAHLRIELFQPSSSEDSPSILQDAQGHPLLPNVYDPNTIDITHPTASHHQSPIIGNIQNSESETATIEAPTEAPPTPVEVPYHTGSAAPSTLSGWSRLHLQSLAPANPHWACVHHADVKKHTRRRNRPLQASPPSQRRSQLVSVIEKFLRLEEQRLALDRRMVHIMEQNLEREQLTARAHLALGEGLSALAEAINKRR